MGTVNAVSAQVVPGVAGFDGEESGQDLWHGTGEPAVADEQQCALAQGPLERCERELAVTDAVALVLYRDRPAEGGLREGQMQRHLSELYYPRTEWEQEKSPRENSALVYTIRQEDGNGPTATRIYTNNIMTHKVMKHKLIMILIIPQTTYKVLKNNH